MAITAIDYSEQHHYVSKDDPSLYIDGVAIPNDDIQTLRTNGATIWWWGAIPNTVITLIGDQQTSSTVEVGDTMKQTWNHRTHHRNREAFRFGISEAAGGWDNFVDPKGNAIKPEWENAMIGGKIYRALSEESINRVPSSIVQEVGAHIFNQNSLTDAQRKNLEGLLSQSDGLAAGAAILANPTSGSKEDVTQQPGSTAKTPKARKTNIGKTPPRAKKRGGAQEG